MCKNYVFYYPDGKEINCGDFKKNTEEFIKFYNDCYFSDSTKTIQYETNKKKNTVRKSSFYTEKLIENILEKDPEDFTDSDVALILAWKIGKITHSQSQNKLVLHEDWQEAFGEYSQEKGFISWNGTPVKRYRNASSIDIDIKGIAEYLRKNGNHLNELIGKGEKEKAFEELKNQPWKGIGAVYLITLLYFTSNHKYPGECPIYDRFAMRALLAIKNNTIIGGSVKCGELPDKKSKNFSKSIDEKITEYISMLKDVFGNEYKNVRNIDRALWVYGHLFKTDVKGKCCD